MSYSYPAKRVMDLLRAYDILPWYKDFVSLVLKPAIQAELTAHFSQVCGADPNHARKVVDSLRRMWNEAQTRCEILEVQNVVIELSWYEPHQCLAVTWRLTKSGELHELRIGIYPMPYAEADRLRLEGWSQLGTLTEFARLHKASKDQS